MVARRVVWWISTAILLGVCLPISVCIWLPAMGVVLLRLLFLQCLGALTQLPDCAKGRPRIFFDGTGHLYPFSLGVTAHMMETYTLHSSTLFFAISGGNLSVLCILLNLSPNDLLESQRRLLDDASWLPAMGLLGNLEGLRVWLEETLPLDFHIKATGRLVVVVSYWPTLGFHYISEFSSRSVLIDAIIASCRFPILSWRPQLLPIGGSFFKQCLMFDAGFQNGITPLDELMDLSIRTFPRRTNGPFHKNLSEVSRRSFSYSYGFSDHSNRGSLASNSSSGKRVNGYGSSKRKQISGIQARATLRHKIKRQI
ncbi:hypothetical protein AAMO2058_001190100 [Amorphochlora amoebiformis]